jgi:hypothetical protein
MVSKPFPGGRDSLVDTATSYRVEGSGNEPRWIQEMFCSPNQSRWALGRTQPSSSSSLALQLLVSFGLLNYFFPLLPLLHPLFPVLHAPSLQYHEYRVSFPVFSVDHPPLSSAEVKNEWSCTSIPPLSLHCMLRGVLNCSVYYVHSDQ